MRQMAIRITQIIRLVSGFNYDFDNVQPQMNTRRIDADFRLVPLFIHENPRSFADLFIFVHLCHRLAPWFPVIKAVIDTGTPLLLLPYLFKVGEFHCEGGAALTDGTEGGHKAEHFRHRGEDSDLVSRRFGVEALDLAAALVYETHHFTN